MDPNKKPFRVTNQKNGSGRRGLKNVGFIALIILIGMIIFASRLQPTGQKEVSLTDAVQASNRGEYSSIVVNGNELLITKKGEQAASLKAFTEPNATLKDEGFDYSKVDIKSKPASSGTPAWLAIAETFGPVLVIGAVLFFVLRSEIKIFQ